jgi:hypothetical protein
MNNGGIQSEHVRSFKLLVLDYDSTVVRPVVPVVYKS